MNNKNNFNTMEWKNLQCPKCCKINIGWQSHCLLCGADLSASGVQEDTVFKCLSCGGIVNKGQKFCTRCGYKFPEDLEDKVEESSNVKKCSNCGAELKAGAKFCTACGSKV